LKHVHTMVGNLKVASWNIRVAEFRKYRKRKVAESSIPVTSRFPSSIPVTILKWRITRPSFMVQVQWLMLGISFSNFHDKSRVWIYTYKGDTKFWCSIFLHQSNNNFFTIITSNFATSIVAVIVLLQPIFV
jgi:hypothetical protein